MKESTLLQVARDNWAANQGVDPGVLNDLGYSTPDTLRDDVTGATSLERALGKVSGIRSTEERITCGDCGAQLGNGSSCAHLGIDDEGSPYTIG